MINIRLPKIQPRHINKKINCSDCGKELPLMALFYRLWHGRYCLECTRVYKAGYTQGGYNV